MGYSYPAFLFPCLHCLAFLYYPKTVESPRGTFLLVGTAIMLTRKDLLWSREAENKTNHQFNPFLFKGFNMTFDVHLLSLRAPYEKKVKNHLHVLMEFC